MSITTREVDARDRADMERLAAGVDTALDDLMERHAAPVFHFLCRLLGNADDAADLAQETFVRVYRARAAFRVSEKFSTWLYTIAANLARNHFRWRSRHPTVSLEPESASADAALVEPVSRELSPDQQAQTAERAEQVREAVRLLPPEMREVVVLCEWEERTVAEAASILETTPKSVESRLYRARQLLRKRLARWL